MAMSAALTLAVLGGFDLRLASGAAVSIARPRKKAQALLAYLALHPGQVHLRDKLATLLWPDMESSEARGNLRQALGALRTAVPAGFRLEQDVVSLAREAMEVDATAAGLPSAGRCAMTPNHEQRFTGLARRQFLRRVLGAAAVASWTPSRIATGQAPDPR